MKAYHELLKTILYEGQKTEDRTGTGTISRFGHQMRFDLKKGFPLVTTKKTSFKMIATELLWFVRGDTNQNWLLDRSCKIWDAWANEGDDLFDIYGKQMRRWEVATPTWGDVKIREDEDDGASEGDVVRFPLIVDDCGVAGKLTGLLFENGKGREYVVLNLTGENIGDHREYRVQFLKTGFVTTASSSVVKARSIRDVYAPTQSGVGYWGDVSDGVRKSFRFKRLFSLWQNMINGCYNPSQSRCAYYGGRGVTVSKRWHCLAYFISDVSTIPGYENWLRDSTYQLDKDYYGSKQYSKTTCVFIDKGVNIQMQNQATAVVYDGYVYPTYSSVADVIGVTRGTIRNFLSGARKTDNNLLKKCSAYKLKSGFVCRPRIFIDQLQNVIDSLKSDPSSRRHVVSLWNAADMEYTNEKAALSACHSFFQFYARKLTDGERIDRANANDEWRKLNFNDFNGVVPEYELSCQLYQRSADVFLGVPYNIASYALLTHMVAHLTNMTVGDFIWSGGDCHIYSNHLDQVTELLERDTELYPLPTLKINGKIDSIDDFTLESFEVVDYEAYPSIKAAIST